MKVSRVLIQKSQISIELDEIPENHKLAFVLRDRKTKELFKFDVEQDIEHKRVTLQYGKVQLPETEFARYDLLLADGEQLFRPKIENNKMNLKTTNSDVFYFTEKYYGFRFYITKDNEISVCRGNYLNVEKEFKRIKRIDVPIEKISYSASKIFFESSFISPSNENFIVEKDEGGNYIFQDKLNFKNLDGKTFITIEKKELSTIDNLSNAMPILTFIKDGILYEANLTTDLLDLERQQLFVRDHSVTSQFLTVKLNDLIDTTNLFLFKENISREYFVPITDFEIIDDTIKVPTKDGTVGNYRYRYIILKKNNTCDKSALDSGSLNSIVLSECQAFGLYKEDYRENGLRSDKYNEYTELDEDSGILSYWSVTGELSFQKLTPENYRNKRYENLEVSFSGLEFQESVGKMEIQLELVNLNSQAKLNFYLQERKSKRKFNIDYTVKGPNRFSLDFRKFLDNLEITSSRWDTFVEVYYQDSYLHGKLGDFSSSVKSKFERYLSPISDGVDENDFCLVPYFSVKNELAFIWNDIDKINNEQLEHDVKITASKVSSSGIQIDIELSKLGVSEFSINSGLIKLRNKAVIMKYKIPAEIISNSTKKATVRLKITPDKYHMLPFFWDVFVVLQVGEGEYALRLKNPARRLKRSIMKKIDRNEINFPDGYMIYPYITTDDSYALCYRKRKSYENKVNRFKEKLAYVTYRVFQKYFDKKKIWIGYEKEASVAQDNGYHFFNYCYKNNKKKDFYFVIKTDAEDYQDIKHQSDKILKFMSFKYMVYMFAAELMISSESKGHSYDIRIQKGHLRDSLQKKKFVFLQHGVTALKRVDYVFSKSKNNTVSLYKATSDFEKNIIKNNFGYDESEIMLTGFTRWDVLEDKSTEKDKLIFVMPTWRSWMDGIPEEEFVTSDYYKQYRKLLESKELNDILVKNNITLHFLLHPKFIAYSDKFTIAGDRIQTHQFGEIKINEMLMKSSLLITDYSSVAWEFFYMKKPVLFFQFDQDDYERYQGSYIDLKHDLFGDSASDVDQLLDFVQYYVGNNFEEKPEYGALRNRYFKYVDHDNSKRTFEAIRKFEKNLE